MRFSSHSGIGPTDTSHSSYAHWRTLPIDNVSLTGGLLARRQAVNCEVNLRHGYRTLEQAGNFHDLRLAAGLAKGEYIGPLFMDSDLYKWLEAVSWKLARMKRTLVDFCPQIG